jgi:uncharacterized BrkB/YihY/UPF0761 family membrane protein
MLQLGLVIGWILTVFLGLLGAVILWLILTGRIDLTGLISEPKGEASLSRFQFLVFTFVIAMSLFYLIVTRTPPGYPEIPNQILALLGISGGSYVVAKGIQTSRDIGLKGTGDGSKPVNSGANKQDDKADT